MNGRENSDLRGDTRLENLLVYTLILEMLVACANTPASLYWKLFAM